MFLIQRRSSPLFQIVILNKKSQGQLAIDACCMVLRLWAGSPQGAVKRAALAALPTGSNLARRAGCWALLQDCMPRSLLMLRARCAARWQPMGGVASTLLQLQSALAYLQSVFTLTAQ